MSKFYQGLQFLAYDHLPQCRVLVDTRYDKYALNFAFSGRIRWKMGKNRFILLPAPVAWWTWPGVRFSYGALEGESWDHRYVTFHGERCRKMSFGPVRFGGVRPYAGVSDPERYRSDWDKMIQWIERGNRERAVHALDGLLMALEQGSSPIERRNPQLERIQELIRRVGTAPEKSWDWQREAVSLAVSPVHLRRLFRRLTGRPPHQYLLKARLARAAQAMRDRQETLKEVAAGCGFEDYFHFSKMFKQEYGSSPEAYRRELQVYRA